MGPRRPTPPSPSAETNPTSARAEAVVDKIFARLTQLHPTQEMDQEENGHAGEFARQVIDRFREGVAKTARDSEPEV